MMAEKKKKESKSKKTAWKKVQTAEGWKRTQLKNLEEKKKKPGKK